MEYALNVHNSSPEFFFRACAEGESSIALLAQGFYKLGVSPQRAVELAAEHQQTACDEVNTNDDEGAIVSSANFRLEGHKIVFESCRQTRIWLDGLRVLFVADNPESIVRRVHFADREIGLPSTRYGYPEAVIGEPSDDEIRRDRAEDLKYERERDRRILEQ